eukprot:UN32193
MKKLKTETSNGEFFLEKYKRKSGKKIDKNIRIREILYKSITKYSINEQLENNPMGDKTINELMTIFQEYLTKRISYNMNENKHDINKNDDHTFGKFLDNEPNTPEKT